MTASAIVSTFVDQVLNAQDVVALDRYVTSDFIDHDPLYVDGIVMPRGGTPYDEILEWVTFLARKGVDLQFSLEKISETDDLVHYRMFGHGEFDFAELGVELSESYEPSPRIPYLAGKLTLTYECTGTFRVADGRLVERWGRQVLQ
jgi:SnoaL-like protein